MKTQGTTIALVLVVAATLAACSASAPDDGDEPVATVTVTAEPEPETSEALATDPDQVRYYEAMRGAVGWEDTSDARLDELAEAACTDLRAYTGAPDSAIASMEFTFGEQLGDDALGEAAVSALIERWCPEILD